MKKSTTPGQAPTAFTQIAGTLAGRVIQDWPSWIFRGLAMARSRSVLGDARRDERASLTLDRIVATGSLVLRDVGGSRSGEIGAHRLRASENIEASALLMPHVARTAAACAGPRLSPRRMTTLPIATLADAQDVVRLYRLRWRIEEVFRILKSDSLNTKDSQLETAGRLFNLATLALVAAARIIQLVDARDGSSRPATDILDADEIAAAAAIYAPLEGKTDRQKNHHAPGSLA